VCDVGNPEAKLISQQVLDKPQTRHNDTSQSPPNAASVSLISHSEDVEPALHGKFYGSDVEAQLPLITVLALIQSEKFGRQTIQNLAGTSPLGHQLKSVSDLWQSLGSPDNMFWRGTPAFYSRIVDADDSQKA
jgi:hypothetical protein